MTRYFFLSLSLTIALFACTSASGVSEVPAVGVAAPEFTHPTNARAPASLKDFSGKWVVLYLYPKDFTGGCTLEDRNFQCDLQKYDELGAVVMGVSVDSAESHNEFCAKESLTF